MTQHAEVRKEMAQLLVELPEIVNQCENYETHYPGRNTIQLLVNDIYINLLLALESILEWYTRSSWSEQSIFLVLSNLLDLLLTV